MAVPEHQHISGFELPRLPVNVTNTLGHVLVPMIGRAMPMVMYIFDWTQQKTVDHATKRDFGASRISTFAHWLIYNHTVITSQTYSCAPKHVSFYNQRSNVDCSPILHLSAVAESSAHNQDGMLPPRARWLYSWTHMRHFAGYVGYPFFKNIAAILKRLGTANKMVRRND